MKNKFVLTIALLLILSTISACSPYLEVTIDTSEHERIATQYVNEVLSEDYEKVCSDYDYTDAMAELMTVEFFENDFSQSQSDFGKLIEMKAGFPVKVKNYLVVVFPITFENKKINYEVTFNDDMQIAGFRLNPYKVYR